MPFNDGSYGSQTGIDLIAKALASRSMITYTRAAVGSGTIPAGMTPKTMTDCADYVMDAKIAGITNPVNGECQVTVQIRSDDVTTGFYATNIVLFAYDPDVGEVPFTYLCMENEPEWIRPSSSIIGKLATFDLIVAVGDVSVVTAVIDPDALMTRAEAERLICEATSLSVTELYIPKNGWKMLNAADVMFDYAYYQDIDIKGIRGTQVPVISVHKEGLYAAEIAELCKTIQSMDGKVRLWAKRELSKDIEATLALYDARSAVIRDIVVKANDWQLIDPPSPVFASYAYYQDVEVKGLTQDRFPVVSLHMQSLLPAQSAGMCPTVQALNGVLRFWSFEAPTENLTATTALLYQSSGFGCTQQVPIATDTVLGGVKIVSGSGLLIDGNGYLSVDAASINSINGMFP